MAVGTMAELAVERVISRGLRSQLADARAILDRRAREAFRDGMRHGAAAWPLALLIGAVVGSVATLVAFSLFA